MKKSEKQVKSLKDDLKTNTKNELTVKNAQTQEIGVSLDRLLELRNNAKQSANPVASNQPADNFSRLYEQEFSATQQRGNPTPVNPTTMAEAASLPAGLNIQPGKVLPMQMVNNNAPRSKLSVSATKTENITQQIELLKQELASIAKLPITEQEFKKQEVMEKINQIYGQINNSKPISTGQQIKALQEASTKPLFGVVVNSKNQALFGAQINIIDDHSLVVGQAKSREDGKFAMEIPDVPGNYAVEIIANGFKFPIYKISLAQGKLPAYKFRSE